MSVPQSNIDLINSPKTPSPSTIIPNGSSFPFPVEDSATASNFKISNSSPSRKDRDDDRSIDAILRRSSYNSGKYKEKDDEIPPTLSADLRALVDSTDGSKARRLGTGLKDHPMNRKLSGSGEPSSSSSAIRRERHTSFQADLLLSIRRGDIQVSSGLLPKPFQQLQLSNELLLETRPIRLFRKKAPEKWKWKRRMTTKRSKSLKSHESALFF